MIQPQIPYPAPIKKTHQQHLVHFHRCRRHVSTFFRRHRSDVSTILKLPFHAKAWIDVESLALCQAAEVTRHFHFTADIEIWTVEELSYIIPNLRFCDETEICLIWQNLVSPNILFPPEICETVKSQAVALTALQHVICCCRKVTK